MTDPMPSPETLIEKLEQLWQQGEQPDPFALLQTAHPLSADVVARILAVDQWQRWHIGQRVSAEDYLRRAPMLAADADARLEIVYGEFLVRHALGEKPPASEYLNRFPQLAAGLGEHFALFKAIEQSGGAELKTFAPHKKPINGSVRNRDQLLITQCLPDKTQDHPQDEQSSSLLPEKPPRGFDVPGYEILEELGRGGMGVVYKARDVKLHRLVAIKMILAGSQASPEQRDRFLTEAQSVAQMHHPNVVPIFEIGRRHDFPYFAMELVSGGNLTQKLQGIPLPPAVAAQIMEQLARGVQAAHERNIVHRDLKPSNVLLTEDGTPKIADFGLAKRVQAGDAVTVSGHLVGTPSYMAPEQADGKNRKLGPACDIYALGAILYELLTGRPPFKAASVLETLHQVCTDEPVPPRQFQSKTPKDLETICLKCLQKDPGKRYASARALAEDLARFQAGHPVLARPVGALERTWRWCRRHPAVAGLTAAISLLLLLLAIGSSISAFILGNALADSEEQRGKAERAEKAIAKERDDALKNLAQAYLEQARAKRLSGRMGQRFDSLDAIKKAIALTGPTLDLRNAALACLVLPDVRAPIDANKNLDGLVAPDLQRWMSFQIKGDTSLFQLRDAGDNRILAHLSCPGFWDAYDGSAFSPDSRLFGAACRNGQFRVWRLEGNQPALLWEGDYGHCLTFSGDSRQVAVWDRRTKTCRILDLADKREVRQMSLAHGHGMAFHPRLPRLALVEVAQTRIVAIDTGEVLAHWPTPGTGAISHVAWHPEGLLIAIARKRSIHLCNPDSGSQTVTPLVVHGEGIQLSFNPSGNVLANTSWNGDLRLWDCWTGRLLVKAPLSPHTGFRFGKDNVLFPIHEHGRVEAVLGRELRVFQRPIRQDDHEGYFAARISEDGRLLAASTEAGLALLDLSSGRELTHERLLQDANPLWFDAEGALWLDRRTKGVERWPVQLAPDQTVAYGPPQNVTSSGVPDNIVVGSSKDRQILAFPRYKSAEVLHRGPSPFTVPLGDFHDCRFCAVSPDGRWVAAGNHWGEGVAVFEARTGKCVKRDPNLGGRTSFSPDGRWLAVRLAEGNKKNMSLLEVGRWNEWPLAESSSDVRINGNTLGFAFAPDVRSIAVSVGNGTLRVLRVPTGEELYSLQIPEQIELSPQCFSADGALLIAAGQNKLYVWDLRALRRQLRELNLDWDEPPFPEPAKVALAPLKASLVLGAEYYLDQGNELLAKEDFENAITAYEKATRADPKNELANRQLSIVRKAGPNGRRFSEKIVTGTLTPTVKQQAHEWKMSASAIYVLDLESTAFDAFLKLQDAQRKLLAENDDLVHAVNQNSRIVFVPPADGMYRLVATSFQNAGIGAYTLRIRALTTGKE